MRHFYIVGSSWKLSTDIFILSVKDYNFKPPASSGCDACQ